MKAPMKTAQYQQQMTKTFTEHGFEVPEVESAYILSEVMDMRAIELPLHADETLTEEQLCKAENFLRRRLAHEPFQYIFGWTPFRYLELKVGPGVLIPRPETEVLVELVMKKLPRGAEVCELGAGSGAISLSLASERKDLSVEGSEFSAEAFVWAETNRKALGLPNVRFHRGDLFEPFPGRRFDAVVANLPYVAESERALLPPNVRDYEPAQALFAPEEGFSLIERALREAPEHLRPERSFLFFEIGETQGSRALDAARKTSFFRQTSIEPDQYGTPRFLFAER